MWQRFQNIALGILVEVGYALTIIFGGFLLGSLIGKSFHL